MKKILFRKLLFDCLVFFVITLLSTSLIIWIFQAVNFLDIMVEDGRDYMVYVNYSLLNFPKIISKIIPFVIFFSFSYVFTKYELNNELIIFWNFGIHKIELVNFFIKFSILLTLIQLMFTIYIVPETQNISRSLIRSSNVDFFESFIKPKKFNDNIRGLTIYSEEKEKNGDLKNIYLKKNKNNKEFQITIAKKGVFETKNNSKILVLHEGQTINSVNNKITNFSFSKSDFNLSTFKTDAIIYDKIQETKTTKHIDCLKKYLNKDFTTNRNQREYIDFNCSIDTLDNVFQELYKRFIIPLYIPLLISTSLILITTSKEKRSYLKFRIGIFLFGLSLIILSETALKFVKDDFYYNIKIILLPLIIFIFLYIFFKFTLKNKINFKK
jgi:lipopolysaccharide export system permease protein